jgi:hypothetical protein
MRTKPRMSLKLMYDTYTTVIHTISENRFIFFEKLFFEMVYFYKKCETDIRGRCHIDTTLSYCIDTTLSLVTLYDAMTTLNLLKLNSYPVNANFKLDKVQLAIKLMIKLLKLINKTIYAPRQKIW